MTINLSKGGNTDLTKTDPSLDHLVVGLGWNPRETDGEDYDLDASLFLLKTDGKVRGEGDFCYYNQLEIAGGSIKHMGDNRTGAGAGDDEQIKIQLSRVPSDIDKIAVVVTIDKASERGQNFGQVADAYIRIVNETTGAEITRYDLSEDGSTETALTLGEIYRKDGAWKFRAVGTGFQGGLAAMCRLYGLTV